LTVNDKESFLRRCNNVHGPIFFPPPELFSFFNKHQNPEFHLSGIFFFAMGECLTISSDGVTAPPVISSPPPVNNLPGFRRNLRPRPSTHPPPRNPGLCRSFFYFLFGTFVTGFAPGPFVTYVGVGSSSPCAISFARSPTWFSPCREIGFNRHAPQCRPRHRECQDTLFFYPQFLFGSHLW